MRRGPRRLHRSGVVIGDSINLQNYDPATFRPWCLHRSGNRPEQTTFTPAQLAERGAAKDARDWTAVGVLATSTTALTMRPRSDQVVQNPQANAKIARAGEHHEEEYGRDRGCRRETGFATGSRARTGGQISITAA